MKYREQILRKVTEVGNGAHIFVPKEWINDEVFIVRVPKKDIKEEIIKLVYPNLEKVIAIFLYGSYARNEQTEESDIDAIIIAKEKFEIQKKEKFEIILLAEDKIETAIQINPVLLYSILHEAKPLLNSAYLEKLQKIKIKPLYFKDFIEDTERLIKINKEMLELDKLSGKKSSNSTIYSLILRLRGIFIINKILKKEGYSNKNFRLWLSKILAIDYEKIYKVYRIVRDNKEGKDEILIEDAESLLDLLDKETKKLKIDIKRDGK